MWIFTTREVSVIIYSIVFLIYVLIKKGKSVFLPVIKAACHIKLIVPFIFIVTMAIIFAWTCNFFHFGIGYMLKTSLFGSCSLAFQLVLIQLLTT